MRQHAVDDGDVVRAFHGLVEPVFTVDGFIDYVAGFTQTLGKKAPGLRIVFDDQNFHLYMAFTNP